MLSDFQRERRYAFFTHETCEAFPCHTGIEKEQFNCLFCYCPLYALGPDCGGLFTYTAAGVKDCSGCTLPHEKGNYDYMISRFSELAAIAGRQPGAPHAPKQGGSPL